MRRLAQTLRHVDLLSRPEPVQWLARAKVAVGGVDEAPPGDGIGLSPRHLALEGHHVEVLGARVLGDPEPRSRRYTCRRGTRGGGGSQSSPAGAWGSRVRR